MAESIVRRGRWRLRLPRLRPPWLAVAAVVAAGVALALSMLVPRPVQPQLARVALSSPIAGMHSVSPTSRVVLHFDRPMNRTAVAAALRISPATETRAAWRGNDLIVTPLHGLVPNSAYVLTIDRTRARTASGAATSVVMAAGDASGGLPVRVAVDEGSPLGWIDDARVSFVGAGQLRAVDRAGRVSILSTVPVDAARDTVVIAPGSSYVF